MNFTKIWQNNSFSQRHSMSINDSAASDQISDPRTPILGRSYSNKDNTEVRSISSISSDIYGEKQNDAKMSIPFGVFNLITNVIGAGLLTLPYAFSIGGLVPATIALVLTMIISLYSGNLLVDMLKFLPKYVKIFNFEDLSDHSYGIVAKILSLLTIIVLLYPSHIAYMILTRDQLDLIVEFAFNRTNMTSSIAHHWISQKYTLMALAFLPILPICFLPKIRFLGYTSLFSFTCILVVSVSFVIFSILNLFNHTTSDGVMLQSTCSGFNITNYVCIALFPNSIFNFLESLSIISLVFVCHFNILPISYELHNPTQFRRKLVVASTILIAVVVYLLVSYFTVFQFGSTLKPDVMLNYDPNSIVLLVERCVLFLALLPHYPILLYPFRASVLYLIEIIYNYVCRLIELYGSYYPEFNVRNSKILWFIVTLTSFILAFIPACFVTNVDVVWGFVGSIGSVLVVFIWPSLFYLKIRADYWKDKAGSKFDIGPKGVLSIFVLVVGLVIMGLCTVNHILVISNIAP